MIGLAKNYFVVFGILTIIGGVIGYATKGSVPSIIAGTIAGILLVVAAWLLPTHLTAALAIGAVVAIALGGQFIPKFIKTGQFMPAGIMSILSVIGLIVAVLAWIKK